MEKRYFVAKLLITATEKNKRKERLYALRLSEFDTLQALPERFNQLERIAQREMNTSSWKNYRPSCEIAIYRASSIGEGTETIETVNAFPLESQLCLLKERTV
jgi:hypothetical protein